MELQLNFNIKPINPLISFEDELCLIGSCFAENIGEKLHSNKFNAFINPQGILFNPFSIYRTIQDCISERRYTKEDLVFQDGCWHSWNHHGSFSHPHLETCLENINNTIKIAHSGIKKADWLMLTFGSAFVYKHKKSAEIVANCHKVNSSEFEKLLLNREFLEQKYSELFTNLKKFNPKLKVLFTISPVRYIRDGLIENNLSKAILIQLAHTLCINSTNHYYFPAYEIVIDQLRDYRFFDRDMVHPNQLAIDFVWEQFVEFCFSEETKTTLKRVEEIVKAAKHKPFHAGTEAHLKFQKNYLEKINQLKVDFPFLDFKSETEIFK